MKTRKVKVLEFLESHPGVQQEVDIVASQIWKDTSSIAYRWKRTRVALRSLERQESVQRLGTYKWALLAVQINNSSEVKGAGFGREEFERMRCALAETKRALIEALDATSYEDQPISQQKIRDILAFHLEVPISEQPRKPPSPSEYFGR